MDLDFSLDPWAGLTKAEMIKKIVEEYNSDLDRATMLYQEMLLDIATAKTFYDLSASLDGKKYLN